MIKIKVKPLSANRAYKGRKVKTEEYEYYEKECFYELPRPKENLRGVKLCLKLNVGLSNKQADLDNIAKPFIDILQNKYKFNDKMIYKLEMEKENVPKGEEYIEFEFLKYIKRYE